MHANYPASIFKNYNRLLFAKPELTDGIALFPGAIRKIRTGSGNEAIYGIRMTVTGMARGFGTAQQSVGRTTNRTLKEFQEVNEVSNTSPNAKMWSFLETAILYFAIAAAFPYSPISPWTSQGSVASYPGSRWAGKERAWYTLFAHAFNLPKIWGLRSIF